MSGTRFVRVHDRPADPKSSRLRVLSEDDWLRLSSGGLKSIDVVLLPGRSCVVVEVENPGQVDGPVAPEALARPIEAALRASTGREPSEFREDLRSQISSYVVDQARFFSQSLYGWPSTRPARYLQRPYDTGPAHHPGFASLPSACAITALAKLNKVDCVVEPTALLGSFLAQQSRGWWSTPGELEGVASVEVTARVLEALGYLDVIHEESGPAIRLALGWLAEARGHDGTGLGGWGPAPVSSGNEPSVLHTCLVVRALSAFADLDSRVEGLCGEGITWLLSARNDDGGWGPHPATQTTPHHTAYALQTLWTVRYRDPRTEVTAVLRDMLSTFVPEHGVPPRDDYEVWTDNGRSILAPYRHDWRAESSAALLDALPDTVFDGPVLEAVSQSLAARRMGGAWGDPPHLWQTLGNTRLLMAFADALQSKAVSSCVVRVHADDPGGPRAASGALTLDSSTLASEVAEASDFVSEMPRSVDALASQLGSLGLRRLAEGVAESCGDPDENRRLLGSIAFGELILGRVHVFAGGNDAPLLVKTLASRLMALEHGDDALLEDVWLLAALLGCHSRHAARRHQTEAAASGAVATSGDALSEILDRLGDFDSEEAVLLKDHLSKRPGYLEFAVAQTALTIWESDPAPGWSLQQAVRALIEWACWREQPSIQTGPLSLRAAPIAFLLALTDTLFAWTERRVLLGGPVSPVSSITWIGPSAADGTSIQSAEPDQKILFETEPDDVLAQLGVCAQVIGEVTNQGLSRLDGVPLFSSLEAATANQASPLRTTHLRPDTGSDARYIDLYLDGELTKFRVDRTLPGWHGPLDYYVAEQLFSRTPVGPGEPFKDSDLLTSQEARDEAERQGEDEDDASFDAYKRVLLAIGVLEHKLANAGLGGRLVIDCSRPAGMRGNGPLKGWYLRQVDPGLIWDD